MKLKMLINLVVGGLVVSTFIGCNLYEKAKQLVASNATTDQAANVPVNANQGANTPPTASAPLPHINLAWLQDKFGDATDYANKFTMDYLTVEEYQKLIVAFEEANSETAAEILTQLLYPGLRDNTDPAWEAVRKKIYEPKFLHDAYQKLEDGKIYSVLPANLDNAEFFIKVVMADYDPLNFIEGISRLYGNHSSYIDKDFYLRVLSELASDPTKERSFNFGLKTLLADKPFAVEAVRRLCDVVLALEPAMLKDADIIQAAKANKKCGERAAAALGITLVK
ncbi:MAG: hypothetical protein OEW08_09485 [Gammaproteobacteria bacterium]|nr:hypothetical protein [Gammaproteobacteria bacterium]